MGRAHPSATSRVEDLLCLLDPDAGTTLQVSELADLLPVAVEQQHSGKALDGEALLQAIVLLGKLGRERVLGKVNLEEDDPRRGPGLELGRLEDLLAKPRCTKGTSRSR